MHIELNKLPMFWKAIKDRNELRRLDPVKQRLKKLQNKDNNYNFEILRQRMTNEGLTYADLDEDEQKFYKKMDIYNYKLKCPMNQLCEISVTSTKPYTKTYPMSKFFVKFENKNRTKSRKVEKLIEDYQLKIYDYNTNPERDNDQILLLSDDFDEMIKDIQKLYISSNYLGLMS
jgi:hypothetical protein